MSKTKKMSPMKLIRAGVALGKDLIFNPDRLSIVSYVLLAFEIVLNIFIINTVNYTEIDWKAYMQEVEGALNGTLDYAELKGDTGPLVYPAGFVYIFSLFYYLTSLGTNIRLAQYIFAIIYIITLRLVFYLYTKTQKVPPYVLVFMCISSYRIHSIFVLRLFNDCVAMCLLYASIYLFTKHRWSLGCIVYSVAVSVKMNILLFCPALFFVLLSTNGYKKTFLHICECALVQLVFALPFLVVNWWSYIKNSFDLGRVFMYVWTVNWRCVPEYIFVNPIFHITLLSLHVIVLLAFIPKIMSYVRFKKVNTKQGMVYMFLPDQIILTMFVSNFIGIVFARSLHYQFYVWYYHTIPYILWTLPLTPLAKMLLWGIIELAWNTYPSTVFSSILLHGSHLTILASLWTFWPQTSQIILKPKSS